MQGARWIMRNGLGRFRKHTVTARFVSNLRFTIGYNISKQTRIDEIRSAS